MRLILASASPNRLRLLAQAGLVPDAIVPADLDETPHPREHPATLAKRLAGDKARYVAQKILLSHDHPTDGVVLSGDTVVAVGRCILAKALTPEDVLQSMRMLSGKKIGIYTGFAVQRLGIDQDPTVRLQTSWVWMRDLSFDEIAVYVRTNQGIGTSGGCTIEGYGQTFIRHMQGSVSGMLGLPLSEVKDLLATAGYHPHPQRPALVEDTILWRSSVTSPAVL